MSFWKNLLISLIILAAAIVSFCVWQSTKDKPGTILNSSQSILELTDKLPALSFLRANTKSCNWYEQIANKDGTVFYFTYLCYDGSIVLEDDYYNSIVSKYKWDKYEYPKEPVTDFVERPMLSISMIKDSLKTKELYICGDRSFGDSTFYTFLDKENKTLYFYYYQL